mmetsp:Transcript_5661/g.16807  ORF Transcript_5661/g.16807 Transcript_5661/m.16807 type:complete len:212 (-) Transcript_5661:1963-2598(-)
MRPSLRRRRLVRARRRRRRQTDSTKRQLRRGRFFRRRRRPQPLQRRDDLRGRRHTHGLRFLAPRLLGLVLQQHLALLPRDARVVLGVLPSPFLVVALPLQAPLLEQLRVLSTIRLLLPQLLIHRSFSFMLPSHLGPLPFDAPLLPEFIFPLFSLFELLGALLRGDVGLELALPHVGHGLLSALVAVGLANIALELAGRVAHVGRAVQASGW